MIIGKLKLFGGIKEIQFSMLNVIVVIQQNNRLDKKNNLSVIVVEECVYECLMESMYNRKEGYKNEH